jgi:nitroreductase
VTIDSNQTLAGLSPQDLLTTTHGPVSGLDFESLVPRAVIAECVETALQAPAGSDGTTVQFLIVSDPGRRWAFAEIYRQAHEAEKDRGAVTPAAEYLAQNVHRAAALVFACGVRRPGIDPVDPTVVLGNVLPALWSFMLAARLRGLGTSWTTTALDDKRFHELLNIPADSVTVGAMTPVAYAGGAAFAPAPRPTAQEVIHWNTW